MPSRHYRRRQARRHGGGLFPNTSLIVTFNIVGQNRTFRALIDHVPQTTPRYDAEGATMYVVAVIVIYGVSIILLILGTVRGRRQFKYLDQQISSYFKDVERIRKKAMATSVINQSISIAASQTRFDSSTGSQMDALPLILESTEPSPEPHNADRFFPDADSCSSSSTPALSMSTQFEPAVQRPRYEKGILRNAYDSKETISSEISPSSSRSVKFRQDYGLDRIALRRQLRYQIDRGVLRPKFGDYLDDGDTVSAPNSPGLSRVQFKPIGLQLGRDDGAHRQRERSTGDED